jgi:hypothetical protein
VCAKTEREYNAEVVEQGLKNKEWIYANT